jgi:hypothetical protein
MFEHTDVKLPENAIFKISPSGIAGFFNNPTLWYKEHVLKEGGFEGDTASTIGTIVHYCAEQKILGNSIDPTVIEAAVENIKNDNVDKAEVLSAWEAQKDILFEEYLDNAVIDETETSMFYEVKGGVYVAGTCDALQGTTVIDFKNVGKKPGDKIPFNYYIQLMAYAYMYKQQDVPVDRIQIVYTVRPTKTLPARLFVVKKLIQDEDWEMIENTLELVADTIIKAKECPELVYLLFKSMQFKVKPAPITFKRG